MRDMIQEDRDDNEDVELKFIHVFDRIETCDKWAETRTALAKANAVYDPTASPMPASEGRPIGHKMAKAARDATSGIEKLHTSIMACMADAASHAKLRADQAAKMEEFVATRWESSMARQDAKIDLLKANVAAKGWRTW